MTECGALWHIVMQYMFAIGTGYKSPAVGLAEMGVQLATIDMGRILGLLWPLFSGGGELGPHLTQCGWGRGLPPRQVSS